MQVFDKSNPKEAFTPTRDQLVDYLKRQVLCVLSTLDKDGAPESATVAFSVTTDGGILIGTNEQSHKSRNIDGDPRVALTITDENDRYTVQIKGTANKLSQHEFESEYADEHYRQRPQSLPFKDNPGQVHLLVTPSQVRFTDCSVHPWAVTEMANLG